MGLDATICIGTFGHSAWADLAGECAIPSAKALRAPVVHAHAETLAQARNDALHGVDTEFVVFLDADDELATDYLQALEVGSADLRAPSVCYVKGGRRRPPYVPQVAGHDHACSASCLLEGNFLVIGTAVRTELARSVGGFRDWPVYEDWCFFQRCWLAGGSVEAIASAVYVAHVRPDSRNRAPSIEFKNRVHREIVAANLEPTRAAAA